MKQIVYCFLLLTFSTQVYCQGVPQGFNYQGVARDQADQPYTNKNLGIRISIINGTNNAIVYSEAHLVATSAIGVFNLAIGEGSSPSSPFDDIDWGAAQYLIKTEVDPNGGTNYEFASQSKLLSVPYAMYAMESANGGGGEPGPHGMAVDLMMSERSKVHRESRVCKERKEKLDRKVWKDFLGYGCMIHKAPIPRECLLQIARHSHRPRW